MIIEYSSRNKTILVALLYSHDQLYKQICMQNHNDDTIKTSDTFFLKNIPLTLLKGSERVTKGFTVWEVSWRLNRTATYCGHNSISFPFSWAAQPGAWGPCLSGTWSSFQHLLSDCNCTIEGLRAPSAECWFSLPHLSPTHLITNLNFLSPGLYNNLTPTLLPVSVTISHSIQPVHGQDYILIFLERMHLLFTQVHFLFWQLGQGQYVTALV